MLLMLSFTFELFIEILFRYNYKYEILRKLLITLVKLHILFDNILKFQSLALILERQDKQQLKLNIKRNKNILFEFSNFNLQNQRNKISISTQLK